MAAMGPFFQKPEPAPPPEAEAERIPKRDKVTDWRFDQFRSLGFNIFQSMRLAEERVPDLHKARTLIARGCDPDTAFDILS